MSLSGCLNYLGSIGSKDVYQLLNDLNGNIDAYCDAVAAVIRDKV